MAIGVRKRDPLEWFETWAKSRDPADIGRLLIEYVGVINELVDKGKYVDGYFIHDLPALRRFFDQLFMYEVNR